MKTLEILRNARKLIEKPEHWCHMFLARDRASFPVDPASPSACRWCLVGAIRRVGGPVPTILQLNLLSIANDRMTHPEVLAWLDRAIALVERRMRKKGDAALP